MEMNFCDFKKEGIDATEYRKMKIKGFCIYYVQDGYMKPACTTKEMN